MSPYSRYRIDEDAGKRERQILEHLPQVHLIARRIHDRLPDTVSVEDLVSMGVLGLIAAVDNFDPSLHTQLKTYAEHRIRGAILDSLRGLDWAPRDMRKRAREIQAAILTVERRTKRQAGEEEIAAELKVSLAEYHNWLTEIQGLELENLEAATENGGDLLQFISDDQAQLPSALLEKAELQKLLAEAISKMPKMERTVLSMYYQDELNLREIAQVVNLHLSRISQLKAQAILRLRSYIEKRWTTQARSTVSPGEHASRV